MNINDNDVKVLGRVVAITTENKVAEAEQVWDGKFSYNFGGETLGATDQHTINELFAGKILALDAAGLISNGDTLNITKNINFANGKGISLNKINGNLTVTGKLTANSAQIDGKLTAQEIETDDLTVNNSLTGAEDASLNWNGPVNIDGNVKVIGSGHTVRIDGTLDAAKISGPKATTANYGVVCLATGLDDTDTNDVVTVGVMKDCCDDVKARLDALEEAIRNFKYSIVNHSSDAILSFGDPEKGTIIIGPGETAKNAMRGTDVHPLFVASPNPGSELDYISKCKVYVERNGIPELRHSVENIQVTAYDITEYLSPVTGTIHVYAIIGEEEIAAWDVIKNGQHVTIGGPDQVKDGDSGEWPITPNTGYKIDSVKVTMGAYDIPQTAWDGTKLSIQRVIGNVTITVVTSESSTPQPNTYTVTKNVSNGTITGNSTTPEGSTYTATVTPDDGYQVDSVTVTMGGSEVSGAYNTETGVVTVPNVSGNIVITATISKSLLNLSFDASKGGIVFLGNGKAHGWNLDYPPGENQSYNEVNIELNNFVAGDTSWAEYPTVQDALDAAQALYDKIQISTEVGLIGNFLGPKDNNTSWDYDGRSLFTVEKYIINLHDNDRYSSSNKQLILGTGKNPHVATSFGLQKSNLRYGMEWGFLDAPAYEQTDTKVNYVVGVRVIAGEFPAEMLPQDKNAIDLKCMTLLITVDDTTITMPVGQYTVYDPLTVDSIGTTTSLNGYRYLEKHSSASWTIKDSEGNFVDGRDIHVYMPGNSQMSAANRVDITSSAYDGQHTITIQDPTDNILITGL